MKLNRLRIRNYRTLEDVTVEFRSHYTAICGPNDSGKTNVVRAIRSIMREEPDTFFFIGLEEEEQVSLRDDFPRWLDVPPGERRIDFGLTLSVDRTKDAGLYEFLATYLSLEGPGTAIDFTLEVSREGEKSGQSVQLDVAGSKFDGQQAEEVLQRIHRSKSILFHNSAQANLRIPRGPGIAGYVREISDDSEDRLERMKRTVNSGLRKIARTQQREFEQLLGRLNQKYRVGLSVPAFDFGFLPFRLTLGDPSYEVALDDWGSGTKNRTLILMALFRARQIGQSESSAEKITPIIVIEEPESFLHPAAQAEFGRVLQDLAAEFEVQVLVTTHSPYLLNMDEPEANVLLGRRLRYRKQRETEVADVNGDNWVEPFSLALGVNAQEVARWRPLILGHSASMLLVEGQTDREYFELLRGEAHGSNRLRFEGEIVPYEGIDNLRNTVLLRFIRDRWPRLFVTYDLDREQAVLPSLRSLGLERNKHFLAIGRREPGKRAIEGLLPDRISSEVFAANPSVVQAATGGSSAEQRDAKRQLKRLLLEAFKSKAAIEAGDYTEFYKITRSLNRVLGPKQGA